MTFDNKKTTEVSLEVSTGILAGHHSVNYKYEYKVSYIYS